MSCLNRRLSSAARFLVPFFVLPWSSRVANAQCDTGWVAGATGLGINDPVWAATSWDPDGPGPLQPRIVVGGRFTSAGGIPANRVAMWDPATGAWSALGSGMDDYVLCFATLPSGELVAGGGFSTAGGLPAMNIAKWNGTSWSAFGGVADEIGGDVYALAVLPTGELVAGGTFDFAGFTFVNNIASWNGATWSPMGTGMNNYVFSLAVTPSGALIAGGNMTLAGGVPVQRLAVWSGGVWSPFGTGAVIDGQVNAIQPLPGGDIVIGGNFANVAGAPASRLARWSGGAWSAMGAGVNYEVLTLAVLAGGDLVAGGRFTTSGSLPAKYVARWNGTQWTTAGIGTDGMVRGIVPLASGGFVAGGYFWLAGGAPAFSVARACGNANWTEFGTGCAGSGGVPSLSLVSTPQIGGTLSLAVNNIGGIPIMVTGLSPANVNLVQIGFGFGFSCVLLAAPDILQFVPTSGGSGTWNFAIPNDPTLAGVHIWNQVLDLNTVSAVSNGGEGEIR